MMLRVLDLITIMGMITGILLLVQPWWQGGFRVGFFTTLGFTILQVITSHLLYASRHRTPTGGPNLEHLRLAGGRPK